MHRFLLTTAALLFALPALASPQSEKPRLAVSDLVAQGVDAAEAAAVTDAVVQALTERNLFRVLSRKDIEAVLNAERTRQLLGECGTDRGNEDSKCLNNLGDALGAPFLLTGSLSKVGSAYQLTLQTLDTVKARPIGRSTRIAGRLETLLELVPYAAAEASGSPLPPPRPRVVQYSMMTAGSALVIGGGVLGMLTLSREQALNEQLCPPTGAPDPDGMCHGQNLEQLGYYQEQNQRLGQDKTVSLALLGVGVGLIAAGVWLLPPAEQAPRIALVPSGSGIALVGVLP